MVPLTTPPCMHAVIFFSSGRWLRARRPLPPITRRVRIWWRVPRRGVLYFLSWLVRVFSRSPIAHVSIGFEGAVLEPSIHGNRFYPLTWYAVKYPTLIGAMNVPLRAVIDLDRHPPRGPKSPWPTVRRVVLFGAAEVDDCLCIVRECLRQGGLKVPNHILSPAALCRWLTRRGHRYVPFA
jgi:hypothetical protein